MAVINRYVQSIKYSLVMREAPDKRRRIRLSRTPTKNVAHTTVIQCDMLRTLINYQRQQTEGGSKLIFPSTVC